MFLNKKINFFIVLCIMGQLSTELFPTTKTEQKLSQRLLNEILANESVMLFQTLNYHWNLTGPEFHDYHLLFDKQYNALFADLDKIAEHVRAVDGVALGSMKDMLKVATLKEDLTVPSPKQMVANLVKQYTALIEQITKTIDHLEKKSKDFSTKKYLEDLLEQHKKTLWMLKSLASKENRL